MKKLLIALLGLNALLIALLTAQSVQSAPKSYDALKLAQFEKCVGFYNQNLVGNNAPDLKGYPELFEFHLKMCARYRP